MAYVAGLHGHLAARDGECDTLSLFKMDQATREVNTDLDDNVPGPCVHKILKQAFGILAPWRNERTFVEVDGPRRAFQIDVGS
jgi:hypothetical protein